MSEFWTGFLAGAVVVALLSIALILTGAKRAYRRGKSDGYQELVDACPEMQEMFAPIEVKKTKNRTMFSDPL